MLLVTPKAAGSCSLVVSDSASHQATVAITVPEKAAMLAPTPPMGWNSWNKFGCNVSESMIKGIADAMVSSGMKDVGYRYVNIDDCWQISRDGSGTIVAESSRFPGGMAALGTYIHNLGLKYGVYSDRGSKTCAGRPGSGGYETQDAKTYASWGVDYLKYDNCNATGDQKMQYEAMRDALRASGRDIVFSICAWAFASWMPNTGQLWRTTGDINASWGSVTGIINTNAGLAKSASPGHWNDPDMLEVGNGMTATEQRAHFAMWAIMAAPLISGNDLRSMSADTKAILLAKEVIQVDQDSGGHQGTRVKTDGNLEVWSKVQNGTNRRAVALFNKGGSASNMTVNWSDIGLSGAALVRDLWERKDLGTFTGQHSMSVPSHGVALLQITATGK
jgi:alpha-galactosidase